MTRPHTAGAVSLIVGWRRGKHIDGGRVEVTDEVADHLRATAEHAADQVASRNAKTYSGDSYLEDDEVFKLAVADVDSDVVRVVRAAADLSRIAAPTLPEKPLLFYAAVIGDDPSARTAYVRTSNPVVTVGPGRVLTRLRQSLATLSEPVFSLDGKVDLIIGPKDLHVLNQKPFERIFRELPELLERVPEWLADVSVSLPLTPDGLAELQAQCERNAVLRRRLRSIHERGHLSTVTIDEIAEEALRQGINPDEVIVNGELSVASVGPATLLKLLNEDLMVGGLSGAKFEVDRKTPR